MEIIKITLLLFLTLLAVAFMIAWPIYAIGYIGISNKIIAILLYIFIECLQLAILYELS